MLSLELGSEDTQLELLFDDLSSAVATSRDLISNVDSLPIGG